MARVGLGVEDLAALGPEAWRPRPVPLVLSSLLLLAAYVLSAGIWGRMQRELGGPPLRPRESVPVYLVANLVRYVPGKVWQIASLAALARGRGVPVAAATGAAVIGQGAALVAAAALGVPALLASPEPWRTWGIAGAAAILAALLVTSRPRVFGGLLRAWFRLARAEAPEEVRVRDGARWLGLYVGNWVLYAAAFALFVRSFGHGGAPLLAGSSFAAAYVIGYVMVFAPAGLGPREGFLIAFLAPHYGAGPAGVVAVAARLWTTLVEVAPAAVLWRAALRAPAAAGDGRGQGGQADATSRPLEAPHG